MTSSHHGLYAQGFTRATMVGTEGCEAARRSKSQKPGPSSDWRLKFASMKPESLVIAYQNDAVNVFLSLVHTARQVMEAGSTRSPWSKPQGRKRPTVNSVTGTKS